MPRTRWAGVAAVTTSSVLLVGMLATASPAAAAPPAPPVGARPGTAQPSPLAGGTVYYVAADGDDTAAGTSPAQAWASISRIEAADLQPGDVVAFERGATFEGAATLAEAGTVDAPITITAYGSGAQPVLTNPGELSILRLDAANITVADLKFTDSAVFSGDPDNGITEPEYIGSGAIVTTSAASATTIRDNTFTNVGLGAKVYGADSTITHNTFRDLRIAFRGTDHGTGVSYGAIGVSANNSGIEIGYNLFVNCRSTDSPYGADGGAVEIEGFYHDKDNIQIHHNVSRGSQGFLEVTETSSANVSLRYNVSDDYQQFIAWDTTTTPTGYVAEHNTIVRQRDTSRLFDQYYYREAGPAPDASWITIRDNVIDADAWLSFYDFPREHNLYSPGVGLDGPLGAGEVIADPQFVDAANGDLRLAASSPAVDAASGAPDPVDVNGNPSTVGAGADLGAIERQATPTRGSNIVTDGSFETQTGFDADSEPWFSKGNIWYGIDAGAGKARTGDDNAWIAGSGTLFGALEQKLPVTANTVYELEFYARGPLEVDDFQAAVRDADGQTISSAQTALPADDYQRHLLRFTTGTAQTVTVSIGMGSPNGGYWLQLDDVSVVALTNTDDATPPGPGTEEPGVGGPGTGGPGAGGPGSGTATGSVASNGSTGVLAATGSTVVAAVAAVAAGLILAGWWMARRRRTFPLA